MSQRRRAEVTQRRGALPVLLAAGLSLSLSGCVTLEDGVGTTLDEVAAARAAAGIAVELQALEGVGYVASDYDAVSSRLHLQVVLTGDAATSGPDWEDALDIVLAAEREPALAGSAVAATVLTDEGAGLALTPQTIAAPSTPKAIAAWLDLAGDRPIDFMVDGDGGYGNRVEVSIPGLSVSEASQRLDRLSHAADIARSSSTMTSEELDRVVTTLRAMDASVPSSWFLPGLISVLGSQIQDTQLDALQAVLNSVDPTSRLAVTNASTQPSGLLLIASTLGLGVTWWADDALDPLDVRRTDAWPTALAIVRAISTTPGSSFTLMGAGEGASLIVGDCAGTLAEPNQAELALAKALREDLGSTEAVITPGFCSPTPP